MKKIIVLLASVILLLQSINACPFCGCGVGNFYMGLLPNFKNKFIGLRYEYMPYHTQLTSDATQQSNDFYTTVEIWSGWNIGKKWQLLTFIPFHFNTQYTDDGIKNQNGIGDISLLMNYNVFDIHKMNGEKTMTEQQLWIGGGVKLPTGKYNVDLTNPDASLGDVNAAMGTGSTDFLLNASYNVRINNFGINTSANYKINTTNSEQFIFGNHFTANSFAYYHFKIKTVNIMPDAGLLYEHADGNLYNSKIVQQTGGYVALCAAGAEISFRKITVGFNAQIPFSQNLSNGQTQAGMRAMAHISFTL